MTATDLARGNNNRFRLDEPCSAADGLPGHGRPVALSLDLVVPVYNEQGDLEPAVRRLHHYLSRTLPYSFRITVADNASTDRTAEIADTLAAEIDEVHVVHLAEKGRGRALKAAWAGSDAEILAYMDVDLSTDLAALLPLIAPLLSGHSDLAIGTRLARSSRVVRGPKREIISRCYNLILRSTLAAHFSDAQCGFKAIRADVAGRLLPLVQDNGWFFDTELLVLAERSGLRIHEVPVDWVDDPDSRVDIVATAVADLKGVWRVGRALAGGTLPLGQVRAQLGQAPLDPAPAGVPVGMTKQIVRFAAIGVLSTLAYLLLFLAISPLTGSQPANFLALAITAVANTAANRRFTFGVRDRTGVVRHQAQGFGIFLLGWGITAGSLALLGAAVAHPGTLLEVSVLIAANLLATVVRFLLLRGWVFRKVTPSQQDPIPEPGQIGGLTMTTATCDASPAQSVAADRRPIRALVVDDENSLSELVTLTLQLEGWSVHAAADGRAALAAARMFEPDIVILDMMLPDMNGISILRELRRHNPSLPVVFLTARDDPDDRQEGLKAGADDYLTKPFSLAELLRSAARGAVHHLPESF